MKHRKEDPAVYAKLSVLVITVILSISYPCYGQVSPAEPKPGEKLYVFQDPSNKKLLIMNLFMVQNSGRDTLQAVAKGYLGGSGAESHFYDTEGNLYDVPTRKQKKK